MPLHMAKIGEINIIKRISGKDEIKQHLSNLGFVVGGEVIVVNELSGNLIVDVKGSRVGISKEMAAKILV